MEMQHDTCDGGNVKVSVEKLPGSEALVEFDFSWDEVKKLQISITVSWYKKC